MPLDRAGRSAVAVLACIAILTGGGTSLAAQNPVPQSAALRDATLEGVSLEFALAWGEGGAAELAAYFAPSVRFTERGTTHDGTRPMQVAEALERFRAAYEGPALDLERVEPTDPAGASGFAELVWRARNRESGTPRRYTFLVTWRLTKAGWRIDELRLIP